jgi:hypothetical protein
MKGLTPEKRAALLRCCNTFSGKAGTTDDPELIATCEQLVQEGRVRLVDVVADDGTPMRVYQATDLGRRALTIAIVKVRGP